MQPLSQTIQGSTYTIQWMFGLPEVLEKMHKLHLYQGSSIRVLQKYKDCLIISSGSKRIAIGNEVADRIQV